MALVNEIIQMRSKGIPEEEIIKKLQEEGFSPLEIKKALEQSKIKEEIGKISGEQSSQEIIGMQPSIMEEKNSQASQYAPQPSPQYEEYTPAPSPSYPTYQYQESQPYYSSQYPYQEYSYYQTYEQPYQQYQSQSTEMITELTEQIVEEKINEIRKKILELFSFKTLLEKKVENIDERLKKIENMFQELQLKILDKVSSYSQNLDIIKKEMEMMQDSFSKIVNPLIDLARERKKKK